MISPHVKLVCRRLYDAQKLRIQGDLRLQRLKREGISLEPKLEANLELAQEYEVKAEKEYEKAIWKEIKTLPIIKQWLGRVHGIGPRLSLLLVSIIDDIGRFENVSKLWAYAGLHVKDGKAVKRTIGTKSNWSSELKTTCWKISGSFVKLGGPYREVYDHYKQRIIIREVRKGSIIWKTEMVEQANGKVKQVKVIAYAKAKLKALHPECPEVPEWTMGRIDNMAKRYAVKLFLSHLWHVWREIEGLSTRGPYALEHGHTTFIDPWKMVA